MQDETFVNTQPGGPETGTDASDALSKRNLWTFSLGTVGRDMAYSLFNSFLLSYILFTKTLTKTQFAMVSVIIIAARIFDALNDPIMGGIVENTRTRFGKFKPWILAGVLSCSGVIIATFSTTLQGWNFIIFLAFIYFMFSITYTMNDISYWGMLPSLSKNTGDRNRLTSLANLCAGAGGALVGFIVPTFTAGKMTLGGNSLTAYRIISIVIVLFFIGCQILTCAGVKEKPLPAVSTEKPKIGLKQLFKIISKNDQLLWISLIFIIYNIGSGAIYAGLSMIYIYLEFGYNGLLMTVFGLLGGAVSALIMAFYPNISKKFTRRQLLAFAIISICTGYILMLIFGAFVPSNPVVLKFALLMISNLFFGAGQSIFYLVLFISIANTVEYNEWKTGNRDEGLIFSLRPFTAKMGSALTQLVIMIVYLIVGITSITNGIADLENNASRGIITATEKIDGIEKIISEVPQGKKIALLIFMTSIPVVLISTAYLLYKKKFKISEEKFAEITAEIAARKDAASE